MSKKRPKPKCIISTGEFRIVRTAGGLMVVEQVLKTDAMNRFIWQRFEVGTDQHAELRFRQFAVSIARTLELRAKRRRKSR